MPPAVMLVMGMVAERLLERSLGGGVGREGGVATAVVVVVASSKDE